jgi:PAS domain S-box-containing protein
MNSIQGVVNFLFPPSNERMREITEKLWHLAPQVLHLHDFETGRLLYVNVAIQALLGYTLEEIRQMESLLKLVYPDDLSLITSHFEKLPGLTEGQSISYSFRVYHKQGNLRTLESKLMVFSKNAAGQPKEILGTTADISEHYRLMEELKNTQYLYTEAEKNVGFGIWEWNMDKAESGGQED